MATARGCACVRCGAAFVILKPDGGVGCSICGWESASSGIHDSMGIPSYVVRDKFGLLCVHLVEYPCLPKECRYAHGLGSQGPLHRTQSGHAVCAACGIVVYGAGNNLEYVGTLG